MKKKKRKKLNVSIPGKVADTYIQGKFLYDGMSMLRRFNANWFSWEEGKYGQVSDECFRASLRSWMNTYRLVKYGLGGELVNACCTIRVVAEVVDAVIPSTILETEDTSFFWLDEDKAICKPASVITFKNGLYNVENNKLYKHTPNWFSTSVLPFEFDKSARCPRWLSWLNTTCNNDKDWIRCLQLWFGYNLVPDTSGQRFAHFYGPPRSGKGTATRVLSAVLGRWNCSNPTLTQLGSGSFGLAPLVGKLAALISDALIGRSVDSKVVLEILSTVIGEDLVDVGRKFLPTLNGVKLNTRFTITSNEPLKWPDPTNKLVARSLVFPFIRTFVGKEDAKIEVGIMEELPGIANWAIRGLMKLRNGSKLTAPKSGLATQKIFSDLDSPILLFCSVCLKLTSETDKHSSKMSGVPADAIHDIWMIWSREEGRPTKGQTRTYVRSLMITAMPLIKLKKRGPRGKQVLCYTGVKLTTEGKRLYKTARKRRKNMYDFKKQVGLRAE